MKLIIQIPCYNEEQTLPVTLADLPTAIDGVDIIEVLVVNDGSTDGTVAVAKEHGVHHIVELPCNRGLAHAWSAGLDAALGAGADIIVNTDGDNQYCGADIETLVRPILDRQAEMVIGARPIEEIGHFSWLKKRLQRFGSWVVSRCAGVHVDDAASGFRAYSADAACVLNVLSYYSHTTESLIRAAQRGITIRSVPVRVNDRLRKSRLISSMLAYVVCQARDIFRILTLVHPLKTFGIPAVIFFMVGLGGGLRFLFLYFRQSGSGHVQSLLFSVMMIVVSFILGMLGVAADMISSNHRLIEDVLARLRRLEVSGSTRGNTRK